MYKDTEELFKSLDIDVNPNTIVGKLISIYSTANGNSKGGFL